MAMWPRMPPKPVSSSESDAFVGVPTSSTTGMPAARATSRPTTSSAMNGSSLSLMMANSRTAIADCGEGQQSGRVVLQPVDER